MTVDTIRAVFTYLTTAIVVMGGGAILFAARADPSASDTRVVIAGFIGSALTFLYGAEVQTRTARQATASTLAAAHAANGGGNGG